MSAYEKQKRVKQRLEESGWLAISVVATVCSMKSYHLLKAACYNQQWRILNGVKADIWLAGLPLLNAAMRK